MSAEPVHKAGPTILDVAIVDSVGTTLPELMEWIAERILSTRIGRDIDRRSFSLPGRLYPRKTVSQQFCGPGLHGGVPWVGIAVSGTYVRSIGGVCI